MSWKHEFRGIYKPHGTITIDEKRNAVYYVDVVGRVGLHFLKLHSIKMKK